VLAAAGLCGCAGGGRVDVTSLNFRAVDPPPATVTPLAIDRCYWWEEDNGSVWIAMEATQGVPLRPEKLRFQLSLVLDGMPAGHARTYLVARRELRAVARLGPLRGKYTSLEGVVALNREGGQRLSGSFRIRAAQESLLLLNWSRPSPQLLVGTFEAVHDAARGQRIAADTEAYGEERPPATQPAAPATQPAHAPRKTASG